MLNSPTIAGFLQCNGRKLEEAEAFKCVFVIYCVFKLTLQNSFTMMGDNPLLKAHGLSPHTGRQ